MRKYLLLLILSLTRTHLFAQEAATQAEDTAALPTKKRQVHAEWSGNGAIYKGDVIEQKDGKSLIQWEGGNPAPSWVEDSKVYDTLDELKSQGKKVREVYAESATGYYYRGLASEAKDGKTFIYWEAGGRPEWVDNAKVKPRKGHGLKKDLIADRELSKAEKAQRSKEDAQDRKERGAKYSASCSVLKTHLDCMRTYDPCSWNSGRCQYRGY